MANLQEIILVLTVGCMAAACDLNLNASDDGTGGTDPDSTVIYQNVSQSHLPSPLNGISQKAKAADIDNDGDLDVIVAVQLQENKVLVNDGSGAFIDESDTRLPALSYDSQDIAVADFNGDGSLDLFFVGNQNETNEFYINDTSGNFSDLTNRIPVTGNSTTVEALDIDGEGSIDILIGNLGQNIILMNNGNALFNNQTIQRLPEISDPTQNIAVGDVTGDNLRDMVVGNEHFNLLLVHTGSGFFADQTNDRIPFINAIEETQDVNIADVNGDGARDIYFGNSGFQNDSNPQDRLLINDGSGFFSDQTIERLPAITTNTFDAEFADLDIDGDLDLVVGNYDGGFRVLTNDGDGIFTDQTGTWIPENFTPLVADIEIADFNDDLLPDIYIAVRNGSDQLLFQQNNN